jgi:hypothetical protein
MKEMEIARRDGTVGSRYRTSSINCDDPVHGRGPGEIVFRHMSVVQRGVRSHPPGELEQAKNLTSDTGELNF